MNPVTKNMWLLLFFFFNSYFYDFLFHLELFFSYITIQVNFGAILQFLKNSYTSAHTPLLRSQHKSMYFCTPSPGGPAQKHQENKLRREQARVRVTAGSHCWEALTRKKPHQLLPCPQRFFLHWCCWDSPNCKKPAGGCFLE